MLLANECQLGAGYINMISVLQTGYFITILNEIIILSHCDKNIFINYE